MANILFVEDHYDTGLMVQMLLADYGYEVTVAETMAEGADLAKDGEFDLFLMDNRFPDGSGAELCSQIRTFDDRTPVVFFSGENPSRVEEAMKCGAQGFVHKPNFQELPAVITSLLGKRSVAGHTGN